MAASSAFDSFSSAAGWVAGVAAAVAPALLMPRSPFMMVDIREAMDSRLMGSPAREMSASGEKRNEITPDSPSPPSPSGVFGALAAGVGASPGGKTPVAVGLAGAAVDMSVCDAGGVTGLFIARAFVGSSHSPPTGAGAAREAPKPP